MRRVHLVELEDLPWFPAFLRSAMTDWLPVIHGFFGTSSLYAPVVADVMAQTKTDRIVDLCSGGGGCLPSLLKVLDRDFGLKPVATLTDLYPNPVTAAHFNGRGDPRLTYKLTSVDATAAPADLHGIRTLIAGFHHLRPDAARAVLADAARQRRPICVFETTVNHPVLIVLALLLPVFVLFTMPLVRPVRWSTLLLTYVIPILPLLIFFDGFVSNLRTYSPEELREMTDSIATPDYHWTIGTLRKPWHLVGFPYLTGVPK